MGIGELWEKLLDPYLSDLWSSIDFWRWLATILVTVGAGIVAFRKRIVRWLTKASAGDHDRRVFEGADETLGEARFRRLLKQLRYALHITAIQVDELKVMAYYLQRTENEFLDRRIRSVSDNYSNSLWALLNFIDVHFSADEGSPENPWKLDRNREDYDTDQSMIADLKKTLAEADATYTSFQSKVKKELHI